MPALTLESVSDGWLNRDCALNEPRDMILDYLAPVWEM